MANFVAYLPVGFPTYRESIDGFKALIDAGVDVLEIGMPYSDPVMDGPQIQKASKVALNNGFTISDVFRAVEECRIYSDRQFENGAIERKIDIYVMGYFNMVFHYGFERFAGEIKDAGATGTIIPDLIPDEAGKWLTISRRNGLKNVFLTATNSTDQRLDIVTRASSGFVYATSLLGVTGERNDEQLHVQAREIVQRVRDSLRRVNRDTPIYLGIGVSSASSAAKIAQFADGVIVGSRLVKALADGGREELFSVASNLQSAIKSGKRPSVDFSANSTFFMK